jgi:hypothetical protein
VGKKKASKLGVSFKKAQNGAGDGTVARAGSGSGNSGFNRRRSN